MCRREAVSVAPSASPRIAVRDEKPHRRSAVRRTSPWMMAAARSTPGPARRPPTLAYEPHRVASIRTGRASPLQGLAKASAAPTYRSGWPRRGRRHVLHGGWRFSRTKHIASPRTRLEAVRRGLGLPRPHERSGGARARSGTRRPDARAGAGARRHRVARAAGLGIALRLHSIAALVASE